MFARQAANHWMYVLLIFLPVMLMSGCTHSRSISPEASLPGVPIFTAPEAQVGITQMTASPSADNEQESNTPITLVKSNKKETDCEAEEVDKEGKPIIDETGKKHWPCQKVANGAGGYKCTTTYEGRLGCNSCPSCKCTTVGSGATQNCKCQ